MLEASPPHHARALDWRVPWAVTSLRADIQLNVLNNSYDRMYL